jgi:hypothetical protein
MSIISRKVRLLCWNYDPCLTDFESEHLVPTPLLRHRQRNPSGILLSTDHVFSVPPVLHSSLDRSSPTSFRNSKAMASLQNKHRVRSTIFRQHRTSVWQPRGETRPPQTFVLRYDLQYMCHHYTMKSCSSRTSYVCSPVALLQYAWCTRGRHDAAWVLENTERNVIGM